MNDKDKRTIHLDNPVDIKDKDTLGRSEFADKIGKTLNQYIREESLVIGIYGKWGTGKTSVINMILETAAEESKNKKSEPIILHFCPWYFSGQDQLLEQFFKQLAFEIQTIYDNVADNTAKKAKNIGDSLIKFSKVLKPVKYITPSLLGIPSDTTENILEKIREVGDAFNTIEEEETFNPNITKKEISDELKELDRKVIIVIDDIDRLTKTEIRQIFQLVKALADFPNTIYLLSFDKDIVCEAMSDVQTGDANKYLEKIIQIPFELPSISPTSLHMHLTSNLDKIIGEDFNDRLESYWGSIYFHGLKYYFTNLREINRFLNLFQFEYSLLRGEVNLVDLIAITAIKSQDTKLYQFISHNKEVFCDLHSENENLSKMEQRLTNKDEYLKSLKKQYIDERSNFDRIDIIEPALKEIFPHFKNLLSESPFKFNTDHKSLKREQNIANPEYFDRFFYLCIPEGQISDEDLKNIINKQNNPESFLTAIEKYNYKDKCTLIELFRVHLNEFNDESLIRVARVVAPIAEKNDEESKRFELSLSDIIRFFISDLFEKDNTPVETQLERYKALFDDNAIGPYILSILLYDVANTIDAYSQDGHIIRERIEQGNYNNEFFALEKTLLVKIENIAESGALQKHQKMSYLLYLWNNAAPDKSNNYIKKLLNNDEGVIDFVTAFLTHTSTSNGRISHVHKKYIERYTNEEELVKKVRVIKGKESFSKLPETSREAIEALLRRIDNPNSNDDDFLA